MDAKMVPVQIFPTVVWAWDLPQGPAMNGGLAAFVDGLLTPRPPVAPGASWQTAQDLQERPELAELVAAIRSAGETVLNELRVQYEDFEITGCWANIAPPGGAHQPHHHGNNYLSGVYYVQAQEGANGITFHEPRPQPGIVSPPLLERNAYNAWEVNFGVQAGRMVIFPAWLTHSVPLNQSGRERISISFNLMFSDFTKTIAKPQWAPTQV